LPDDVLAALVARFRATGFDAALVGEADAYLPGVLRQPRLPLVHFFLEGRPEPGAALARLFAFDDLLGETEARDALGSELFGALEGAGVVARTADGRVRGCFLVNPTEAGVYVFSDSLGAGRDAVMGPGGGTEHLARLVPNAFLGRALDIGCGAGTLALVAARRGAKRAVGVDLNPRAIELSRFNARLNGLDAEFRVGDSVEPVASESFDLVLSQPPFVGRPPGQEERTFLFGGAMGDELALRFLAAAPKVLAPGGRALFLLQSAEREGEPLMVRVRAALGEAAPHVLVLSGGGPTPQTQASVFASFEDPTFGEAYARAARRYLGHFSKQGIVSFGGALVALGRPTPAYGDGRYALGITLQRPHYDAVSLDTFLRALDLLEAPNALLEGERLRLSPYVRAARDVVESESAPGSLEERAVLSVSAPGIGTDWPVAPAELEVLSAIDRSANVGEALDALARAAPGLASLRDELLGLVRNALLRGVLVR
jgi:methylase of polypeptide subunit release factors